MDKLLAIPIALANISFFTAVLVLGAALYTWPFWLLAWIIWRHHF